MNILHINSYYSKSRFYSLLFEEQKKKGNKVEIYVPVRYDFDFSERFTEGAVVSRCFGNLDRLQFSKKERRIFLDFVNKYKSQDFDIVHAHSLFSNGYIAYKYFLLTGTPYVVAVRNTDINIFFRVPWLKLLGNKILLAAKNVIFLSPISQKYTIEQYVSHQDKNGVQGKSIVIPNGIDPFWLENISMKRVNSIHGKIIKIICVGDINRNKNAISTVRACNILGNNGYIPYLTLIGNVKDKEYTRLLKKNDFVTIKNFINKEELIHEYRDNDIYVMPSHHETFGLVYAEAMSQGLPVIYSRGQGFDGQFREGEVGYSVNSHNPGDIAKAIICCIQDYKEMVARCLINVQKFDWVNIEKDYEGIYK